MTVTLEFCFYTYKPKTIELDFFMECFDLGRPVFLCGGVGKIWPYFWSCPNL